MVHQSVAWTHTHKHTRARTHARTSRCNLESPINVLSMFFDFFMFFGKKLEILEKLQLLYIKGSIWDLNHDLLRRGETANHCSTVHPALYWDPCKEFPFVELIRTWWFFWILPAFLTSETEPVHSNANLFICNASIFNEFNLHQSREEPWSTETVVVVQVAFGYTTHCGRNPQSGVGRQRTKRLYESEPEGITVFPINPPDGTVQTAPPLPTPHPLMFH